MAEENIIDWYPILITLSTSVIGSFVGGTLLGNYIANKNESTREKQEVKNLQILLNSDFTTFRRMLIKDLKNRKKLLEHYKDGSKLNKENKSWERLQVFDPLNPQRYFLFWKSIEDSGALLKLKPIELKAIRIVMDELKVFDDKFQNNHKLFFKTFKEKTNNSDKQVNAYLDYNQNCYDYIVYMLNIIELLRDIDWIDFNDEILPSTNKKNKSNYEIPEEFKQDWKNIKKKYNSGVLMEGFIKEMEFIDKELKKKKDN